MTVDQARSRISLFDSRGLIYQARPTGGINADKAPFAHALPEGKCDTTQLTDVIGLLRPTAIIGVSAQGGAFKHADIKLMGEINARPIIFPLSNPTHKAECTAVDAYTLTEGRCVFASGSPFDPVTLNEKTHYPGQGNNSYIFPGLSLGVMVSRTRRIPDDLFIIAAKSVANQVTAEDRKLGKIYPGMEHIRKVSTIMAAEVAEYCFDNGLSNAERPENVLSAVKAYQYDHTQYPAPHQGGRRGSVNHRRGSASRL